MRSKTASQLGNIGNLDKLVRGGKTIDKIDAALVEFPLRIQMKFYKQFLGKVDNVVSKNKFDFSVYTLQRLWYVY